MATEGYTSQTSPDEQSTLTAHTGGVQQIISAVAGASLAAAGLARRGRLGLSMGMIGSGLLIRAASRMPIISTLVQKGRDMLSGRGEPRDDYPKDVVQEASEQSFPASDAPGYW